jgi:hypothetical protein
MVILEEDGIQCRQEELEWVDLDEERPEISWNERLRDAKGGEKRVGGRVRGVPCQDEFRRLERLPERAIQAHHVNL